MQCKGVVMINRIMAVEVVEFLMLLQGRGVVMTSMNMAIQWVEMLLLW